MKKGTLYRNIIVLCVATLVAACARTGYPSGGETDRTPPVITRVTPENRSTNFSAKGFTLETDEYVVLKDANNQVIISPPMKQFPQITSTGKKIKVVIKDTSQRFQLRLLHRPQPRQSCLLWHGDRRPHRRARQENLCLPV